MVRTVAATWLGRGSVNLIEARLGQIVALGLEFQYHAFNVH
jgi:hypothetical protein